MCDQHSYNKYMETISRLRSVCDSVSKLLHIACSLSKIQSRASNRLISRSPRKSLCLPEEVTWSLSSDFQGVSCVASVYYKHVLMYACDPEFLHKSSLSRRLYSKIITSQSGTEVLDGLHGLPPHCPLSPAILESSRLSLWQPYPEDGSGPKAVRAFASQPKEQNSGREGCHLKKHVKRHVEYSKVQRHLAQTVHKCWLQIDLIQKPLASCNTQKVLLRACLKGGSKCVQGLKTAE